jgi:hypothetical protein
LIKVYGQQPRKKKVVDAATLAKIGELARGIEVPASSLAREDAGVVAQQVIQESEDLQNLASSEAENMLMIVTADGGAQEDIAANSDVAPDANETGIPNSPHSHSVIEIGSESTQSSSSSSSTDSDDRPLDQIYKIKHIKPKTNISQEPVRTDIDERVIGLAQRKADLYNRFPVSCNPLRPPMI